MEANFNAIKSLYQEEIDVYKRQIEELRAQNKSRDDKNASLLEKIRELQELIEKANVANNDLHTAFQHVREENLKLQLHTNNQDSNHLIRNEADELALETVQRQYVNLARESVSWISDKDKLGQRIRFLERECERYQRDNSTLGKQVRHLLRSIEEERGMIIRRSKDINEVDQPVRAADVIDAHLVTFESIEELQQQNQKLLSLVKEMSKREEEQEIQVEKEDLKRLNSDIETLKSQLDDVKNDRERIMNAFNTILKERDLFKILLCKTRQVEHLTPEIFQRMVSIACSSGPALTNEPENTQDKEAHIIDLKAIISKLEQELKDLRSDCEISRIKSEEEIKLKTHLLEQAHLKILTESQQTDVLRERNQVLESNIKSMTLEFDETRTKAQKMTFELNQLTQTKKELSEALEQEKQRRQSDISNILAEIQSKCELRFELQNKLSNAEREVNDLKMSIQELESELRATQSELQASRVTVQESYSRIQQLESVQGDLDAEKRELEVFKIELVTNRAELEANRTELEAGLSELQRLRNLERSRRLELSREFFKLGASFYKPIKSKNNKHKSTSHEPLSAKPQPVLIQTTSTKPEPKQERQEPIEQEQPIVEKTCIEQKRNDSPVTENRGEAKISQEQQQTTQPHVPPEQPVSERMELESCQPVETQIPPSVEKEQPKELSQHQDPLVCVADNTPATPSVTVDPPNNAEQVKRSSEAPPTRGIVLKRRKML